MIICRLLDGQSRVTGLAFGANRQAIDAWIAKLDHSDFVAFDVQDQDDRFTDMLGVLVVRFTPREPIDDDIPDVDFITTY